MVHIERERIIISIFWNLTQKVEASEDVVEVFGAEQFFVLVQRYALVITDAYPQLIRLRFLFAIIVLIISFFGLGRGDLLCLLLLRQCVGSFSLHFCGFGPDEHFAIELVRAVAIFDREFLVEDMFGLVEEPGRRRVSEALHSLDLLRARGLFRRSRLQAVSAVIGVLGAVVEEGACVLWAAWVSVMSHAPLEIPQIDFAQRDCFDEVLGDRRDLWARRLSEAEELVELLPGYENALGDWVSGSLVLSWTQTWVLAASVMETDA